MKKIIVVPFLGVNDVECKLDAWEISDHQLVPNSKVIAIVETTKSTVEIHAEEEGYYYALAKVGQTLSVGQPLCLFSTEKEVDVDKVATDLLLVDKKQNEQQIESRVTKKAELLLTKHKINFEEFASGFLGGKKITENDVVSYLNQREKYAKRRGMKSLERIGIIGGAGGGGALILIDSLLFSANKTLVGIFEKDERFHGEKILGVPVLGTIDKLEQYLNNGEIDSVIIAFNRNLSERKRVFDELSARGVKFTNVIDRNAHIRNGVIMGTGNVILSNTYLGSCTEIGNNNFLSANVFIEHGNVLGDGNAFGPGVFTSGNVTIGSSVRFGTGIFVEPNITIGDNAVISSGSIITENVEANSVVRTLSTQQIKQL